jgi:hypothetical protein
VRIGDFSSIFRNVGYINEVWFLELLSLGNFFSSGIVQELRARREARS